MFRFKDAFRNSEEQKEYQDMLFKIEGALYPAEDLVTGVRLIAYCETLIHRLQLEGADPETFLWEAEIVASASSEEIKEAYKWIEGMIQVYA